MKKLQLLMVLQAVMFTTIAFSASVGDYHTLPVVPEISVVDVLSEVNKVKFDTSLQKAQSLLPAVADAVKSFKESFKEAREILKGLPDKEQSALQEKLKAVRKEFKLAIGRVKNKKSGKGKGEASESEDDSDDIDA